MRTGRTDTACDLQVDQPLALGVVNRQNGACSTSRSCVFVGFEKFNLHWFPFQSVGLCSPKLRYVCGQGPVSDLVARWHGGQACICVLFLPVAVELLKPNGQTAKG